MFMAKSPGISRLGVHMLRTVRFTAALAAVLLMMVGCAVIDPNAVDQREVVQKFYAQAVALNVQGLPSQAELAELAPLMSHELLGLFEQARQAQADDFTRHRGTEPPLVQGSILFSLFEGAQRLVAIAPSEAPDMWLVTLAYGQGALAFEWTDEVRLVRQNAQWLIDDIEFMGQWDFARSGWLSNQLIAVQAQVKQ
jgi:hypothetical protein